VTTLEEQLLVALDVLEDGGGTALEAWAWNVLCHAGAIAPRVLRRMWKHEFIHLRGLGMYYGSGSADYGDRLGSVSGCACSHVGPLSRPGGNAVSSSGFAQETVLRDGVYFRHG